MKVFLKSYIAKILFILLLFSPKIGSVTESINTIDELGAKGIAIVKSAIAQYQADKCKPISINIGGERIPTQIVETRGRSGNEIVNDVIQVVSSRLGEIHSLSISDQKKLDAKLQLNKQQLTIIPTDNTNKHSAERRFNAVNDTIIRDIKNGNRQKVAAADQACEQAKAEHAIAYHSDNKESTYKKLDGGVILFINCNHPDLEVRINARRQVVYMAIVKNHIYGYEVNDAAESLISRYFCNNKLVDISYDKRLAETMHTFLSKGPYHRWRNQGFKKLFDLVKKEKLDCGDSFDRLERKINDQLSKDDKKRKRDYKVKTRHLRWNKPEKIFNEPFNGVVSEVAVLCKEGFFENAYAIVERFNSTEEINLMMTILSHYKEKWCNNFGILKKYEHLPLWQQLPYEQKCAIAKSIILQNKMNKQLQEEVVKLQAEIALQEEAELKVASEVEREAELKIEVDSNQAKEISQLNGLRSSRMAERLKALEQSSDSNLQRSFHYMSWSDVPSEFRQQFDLDNLSASINGTPIQHAIQQEFHVIAKDTAQVWKVCDNNTYMQELVKKNVTCIKKGVAQNEKGNIIEAAQLADIAWAVLDHAQAVGEGVVQGTINVAYTFSHPVETVKNIGQLAYIITRSVGKATLEVIDICILGVTNQDAAQKKLKNWEQKFTELTKRAYQHYQEMPSRDITKFISTFVTEAFLTGKALRGLKDFLPLARVKTAKIITQAQAITETPALMTTSEGITAGVNQPGHYVEAISSIENSVQLADITTLKELGNKGVKVHAGATTLVHANQLAKEEAVLKAEADSKQKEKQKSLAPADAQNIDQPISTPAPPSPQPNDPEKNKNQDSEQGKKREISNQAHNANAQAALESKLSALQKAQRTAARTENLPDGRVRYYTEEVKSRIPGPTRGASYVTEHNQTTGQVRSWYECYDHAGNVNRVHPKTLDGQDLISQHYPPTKLEIDAFSKKSGGPK